MMLSPLRRGLALAALVVLPAFSGCHCGKKTDEEILRERIRTTSVYLYVATKIAVTKTDASPEVAAARKELETVLEVLTKTNASLDAEVAPAALGSASAPPSAPSSAPASPGIGAADFGKLAMALWALRSEGEDIVKNERDDKLPSVLPILLRPTNPSEELVAVLDPATEHALFLTSFFVLKFHPKTPVPVPEELLLYEAWSTKSDKLVLDGFRPLVQAMKSVVYGGNELCDLSAKEGALAEADKGDLVAMGATLKKLSNGKANLEPEQAAGLNLAARTLAHGAAAGCYFKRDEREKALPEIQKLIDAAHELGVPKSETALPRAYLFYEQGDHGAAKAALTEAKDDPAVDPAMKAEIEEVLPHLADNDDNFIEKHYGELYFDIWAIRVIYRRLDRLGVFRLLGEMPVARTLDGYGRATSGALGSAKSKVPSLEDAKAKGKGLLEKITQ